MTEHSICPDCGAALPTGATAGLCPKCLLAGAFESSDEGPAVGPYAATTPQAGGFVPPAAGVLAPYFPGLEIVEVLGHGGMGAVYKARQTKLDRIVALKIIRPESADDPAFAERFTREARTLARLSHPNIVAVHDFGELELSPCSDPDAPSVRVAGTLFFFVMEYIDGANLRQVMQAGALLPAQALAIVPQICDALQYAHDEGIIHRDIKPENILIDRRGRVKIADFGLAKLAGQSAENFTLTGTHQVMGTPRYMAPEQMEGSHLVDHRADIYSLGVVFYEMLTGELPLGRFDPPSHKAAVDARMDDVVHRALAKEPSQRYQRASEIRRDVDAVVLDALSHGGVDSLVGQGSIAAGFPGPSTILERQVAGVVNWLRGADPTPESTSQPHLTAADRAAVQRQVRAPAAALMLQGVLLLIPAAMLVTNGFDIADGNDGKPWYVGVVMMVASVCVTVISALVIRGGWHLMSLQGFRPALLGSILGQPIGLWPLIVLSWPDVEAAFGKRGVVSTDGAWTVTNPALWGVLVAGLAIATPFFPWAEILNSARGTPDAWYAAAGFAWPHGLIASSSLAAIVLFLLATAAMRPVHAARPAVVALGTLVVLACTINFDTDLKRGDLAVQPLLDAASWGVEIDGRRPVTIADGKFVTRRRPAPYVLMGLAVALLALAAADLRAALAGRAAPTLPDDPGRRPARIPPGGTAAGQSPVARVGFTVARHDDLGSHIKFQFGELGYRLLREAAGEWVFERGRKSAAFLETDIRSYHATLTVRCMGLGDAGQRVSCTWVVVTWGVAHVTRRDIAALEAEGRELEALLSPARDSTAGQAGSVPDMARGREGDVAAPSEAGVPQRSNVLPDVDLERIQMSLKAPAAGLFIVALLNTVFWCILGASLLMEAPGEPRQFPLAPGATLAAAGGGAAVLLAVAVLINGARHLRRLTGYEWCIAASLLAMVPWAATIVIGFPVGLWAFRTLRRAEVRDAFLKRAIEQAHRRRPSRSGRDWVTLTRDQADNDLLPDVCMVCGAPAPERVNKTFHHAPEWAGLLLLAGLIPGAIALAFTSRTMRVACPMCTRHRSHWSRLEWMNLLGGLIPLLLGAIGYGIGMALRVPHREGPPEGQWIGLAVGAAIGLVIWIAPIIYLTTTRISARNITLHEITFQGVAPEFARAAAAGHGAGRQTIQGR